MRIKIVNKTRVIKADVEIIFNSVKDLQKADRDNVLDKVSARLDKANVLMSDDVLMGTYFESEDRLDFFYDEDTCVLTVESGGFERVAKVVRPEEFPVALVIDGEDLTTVKDVITTPVAE